MSKLSLELKYGQPKHDKIKNALRARLRLAESIRDQRSDDFIKAEKQFAAYLPKKEEDKIRQADFEQGSPEYVTIVIPYSYAVAQTTLTYLSSVFLSRSPVFQFLARNGKASEGELAVESLIDYQIISGENNLAALYVWLLDPLKYGEGILGLYWDEEISMVSDIVEEPVTRFGIQTGRFKKKKISQPVKGFVGNKLYNIRPYDFLRDPSVSMFDFQKGEFCAVLQSIPWVKLIEKRIRGELINFEALENVKYQYSTRRRQGATEVTEIPESLRFDSYGIDPEDVVSIDVHEVHWTLVPKVWGLGESTIPEKWVFWLAQDEVIIGARPLGEYHNQYPFVVLGFDVDAYNVHSQSQLELMQPLEQVLTWLINSHFYNVRKFLNDTIIFDPSAIVMKDLLKGGPGGRIRMKPTHYGTDVRKYIYQLPFSDVTRSHLADMTTVEQVIQRVVGANDNIMGLVNPGGRKTATEVRASSSFATNRLKTLAEWFSATGFSKLAQLLLKQSQQHLTDEMEVRIVGDLRTEQSRFTHVTPDLIRGNYDFIPVDGTMPVDRFAQANVMQQLFQTALKIPALQQQYDLGGLFAHIAHLSGLRNVGRFRVQVQPDQQVANAAERGMIRPVPGGGGPERPRDPTVPPIPRQMPNMGRSG